jgi:hypothetical protein
MRTPVIGFRTTLIQYDLIFTNYICRDLISKRGHILRLQVEIALERLLFRVGTHHLSVINQGQHVVSYRELSPLPPRGPSCY